MSPAEKKDKLLSVMAAFSLEMQALELQYAMVMFDEGVQTPTTTTVTFAGNVTMEAADVMFEVFLARHQTKGTEIKNFAAIRQATDAVQ